MFVKVAGNPEKMDELVYFQLESNRTLLMSKVAAIFPGACGLKYKQCVGSQSVQWRIVNKINDELCPADPWSQSQVYVVIFPARTVPFASARPFYYYSIRVPVVVPVFAQVPAPVPVTVSVPVPVPETRVDIYDSRTDTKQSVVCRGGIIQLVDMPWFKGKGLIAFNEHGESVRSPIAGNKRTGHILIARNYHSFEVDYGDLKSGKYKIL